jgi:hypothetical protein
VHPAADINEEVHAANAQQCEREEVPAVAIPDSSHTSDLLGYLLGLSDMNSTASAGPVPLQAYLVQLLASLQSSCCNSGFAGGLQLAVGPGHRAVAWHEDAGAEAVLLELLCGQAASASSGAVGGCHPSHS